MRFFLVTLLAFTLNAVQADIPVTNSNEKDTITETQAKKESKENIIDHDFLYAPVVDNAIDLELFERHLNKVFSNSIRSMMSYNFDQEIFSADLDLEEYENYYITRIDLPGFDKNSFEIEINQNKLNIIGSREEKRDLEDGVKNFHMSERHYGKFIRTIRLPSNIDPNKSTAKYENGVLIINIPKNSNFNGSGVKIRVR